MDPAVTHSDTLEYQEREVTLSSGQTNPRETLPFVDLDTLKEWCRAIQHTSDLIKQVQNRNIAEMERRGHPAAPIGLQFQRKSGLRQSTSNRKRGII